MTHPRPTFLMPELLRIAALIHQTNNGKLLVARIEDEDCRRELPHLIERGWFEHCMFMDFNDAIRFGPRSINVDLDVRTSQ